ARRLHAAEDAFRSVVLCHGSWVLCPCRVVSVRCTLSVTQAPGQATMDKVTETVVEALKQGMAEPGEQRLFRSGKLSGLFAGRGGVNATAAAQAVRDGLLEVIRNETRGKTVIEWVRVTPRGVDFVHNHESPVRALDELRAVLQATRDGVPA